MIWQGHAAMANGGLALQSQLLGIDKQQVPLSHSSSSHSGVSTITLDIDTHECQQSASA